MAVHDWTNRIWIILNSLFLSSRNALRVISENETQFGETLVAARTPIIELNSAYGFSQLRDQSFLTGSGSVGSAPGTIVISTGTTPGSTARVEAAEVGRYTPGFGAQIGVGYRVTPDPVNNEVARWGGISTGGDDGLYFERDNTTVYAVRKRGGVIEDRIARENWNIDKLDGTGRSKINLDTSKGAIYQIEFTWYGFGQILYGIIAVLFDDISLQHFIPCHSIELEDGEVSINEPNLRVFAEVDNGGDSTDLVGNIGGRQYSVVGNYRPKYRFTSDFRVGVSTNTTVIPLISFQTKAGFGNRSVKIDSYTPIATSQNHILEIRIGGTLDTNANFGTPTNHTASETAVESDTSATGITGGIVIWQGLIASGTGGQRGLAGDREFRLDIPEGQPVSLCTRTTAGSGSMTAKFTVREEW